jgi:hypothetical protein
LVKGITVKSFGDKNIDEEMDSDLEKLEDDFQDTDDAVEEIKKLNHRHTEWTRYSLVYCRSQNN